MPGVIRLIWRNGRHLQYRQERDKLVKCLERAGMPDPAASFFLLYSQ